MSSEHPIGEGVLDVLIADEDDVGGETLARILGALRASYDMGAAARVAVVGATKASGDDDRAWLLGEIDGARDVLIAIEQLAMKPWTDVEVVSRMREIRERAFARAMSLTSVLRVAGERRDNASIDCANGADDGRQG